MEASGTDSIISSVDVVGALQDVTDDFERFSLHLYLFLLRDDKTTEFIGHISNVYHFSFYHHDTMIHLSLVFSLGHCITIS